MFCLLGLALGAAPAVAAPGAKIEIWRRGAGAASHLDDRVVDLDALPLVESRRADVQYAGLFAYRGVTLDSLIRGYAPPAGVDLALLHFANGMQVPVAFRDAALMARLEPFIARQMSPGPGAPFATGKFPPISRSRAGYVDVRPIEFGGNKLVLPRGEHPAVPEGAQAIFSPWMHVDSLTGIELVSAKAYYAQFDVDADGAVRAGMRLYTESCQFCHGARHVGAAFGWDFVEPLPMYSYRGEKNLFYHVKWKPLDASAQGLLMPALSHMSQEDAASIWRWLRAVATKPMPPYAPGASR